MTELKYYEKKYINSWLNFTPNYKLIYSATQDEPTAASYHRLCDGKQHLLSVAYNTDGYCFGGYYSIQCASIGGWVLDPGAFIFQLRSADYKAAPKKYSNNGTGCVFMNAEMGPGFGTEGKFALLLSSGSPEWKGHEFASCGLIGECEAFGIKMEDDENIAGGQFQLYELQVYQLTETPLLHYDSPWRKVPNEIWIPEECENLKHRIIEWQPLFHDFVAMPRILLIGPVGVGKSSFINTIKSVFYGYPTNQAASGKAAHSLTSLFRYYTFRNGREGEELNLQICDTMGLEDGRGIEDADMPYILDGHVPDSFRLPEGKRVTPRLDGFIDNPNPGLAIAVVVIVIGCNTLDVCTDTMREKILNIRDTVNSKGVPVMVLLTKIDELCPHVQNDLTSVFYSTQIAHKIDEVAAKLGVPRRNIFPVKNYEQETQIDSRVDALALMALKCMLQMVDDYFDEQKNVENLRTKEMTKYNTGFNILPFQFLWHMLGSFFGFGGQDKK